MKHIGALLLAFLTCVCVAFMAAGCTDREFNKAAKQAATVKYIAVDEDLNLLSNFIEERDLKEDGLSSNAYFLYGTESTLYFAETSSNTMMRSNVYSYDIASRELEMIFSQSGHGDYGSGAWYLFYVAMVKEDTVTCFYSHETFKMFGNHQFYITATDYTLDGREAGSKDYSVERMFTRFSNSPQLRDYIQFNFLTGKTDRYWLSRSETLSEYAVRRIYTFHGVNGYYDVDRMSSSDAMWNFIHSERKNASLQEGGAYYNPYGSGAAFGLQYHDNAGKLKYVYFHYTEGGEPKYLFTGGKKPLLGLYVVQ